MRPHTGGLYTDIELIELTEGITLPLIVRQHPHLQRLVLITNNVVCWSNDIISLQKERAHRDMHNPALIYQHHYACLFRKPSSGWRETSRRRCGTSSLSKGVCPRSEPSATPRCGALS
jgi:hypothetical protein